ncbi:MAG: flavodoxin family protein [Armatimonadetes bacterium]|nr:flavodoxin family protein [Armatimonadota bacterium]
MTIIAVQTSPNEDGLTARMAKAALEGAEQAGAQTEMIHLRSLNIGLCLACESGWGPCGKEGRCNQDDDFEMVRQKLASADAFVLSSPVYFGEVSEITKCFLDRLRRCEWGLGEESLFSGKPALGVTAAGGSGGGAVPALHGIETYFYHLRCRIFDLLTVTQRSKEYQLEAARAAGAALARFADSE